MGGGGAIRSRLQGACPGVILFFFYEVNIFYFMYMNVLLDCMSMYHIHAWFLRRLEERIRSPGTELMDCCEPSRGCYASSSGPDKQQVLLTAEPSLQPVGIISYTSLFLHAPSPAL